MRRQACCAGSNPSVATCICNADRDTHHVILCSSSVRCVVFFFSSIPYPLALSSFQVHPSKPNCLLHHLFVSELCNNITDYFSAMGKQAQRKRHRRVQVHIWTVDCQSIITSVHLGYSYSSLFSSD